MVLIPLAVEIAKPFIVGSIGSSSSISDSNNKISPLIESVNISTLSKNTTAVTTTRKAHNLPSTSQLPIHLYDTSSNTTALSIWGDIVPQWNRTTQYLDLFQYAKTVPSLPPLQTKQQTYDTFKRRQMVVIIHCGPKVGSTTLRAACRRNFRETCNIEKVYKRAPKGYFDMLELYPLIQSCNDTYHFCTKQTTWPLDVPSISDDLEYLHMFPFRNYDDWAKSALKQQFDRYGEKGCTKYKETFDQCKHTGMEIDFRQYGKTDLSRFKDSVLHRMNEMNERHHILLYLHRDLHDIISMLSSLYNIPMLPGSDGKGKARRPEGTCDESILQQYHDCFTENLMELT